MLKVLEQTLEPIKAMGILSSFGMFTKIDKIDS
jgi:hypothetical protein